MNVLWVILIVIMYVGTIFFIFIKEEEQYNKLIKEYNELVDEFNELEEQNIQLKKEIKASLNRQLLDFLIGNCKNNEN